MKNLLFMLVAATTFFSSCSSDDDGINGNANQHEATKYKVNLNVKSAGFEIDKTPLKATFGEFSALFQVVTYKESGEVYADTLFLPGSLKKLLNEDGSLPLSLDLPAGNYHLAIMYSYVTPNPSWKPETFKLNPKNYYTDQYGGGRLGLIIGGGDANIDNYYETLDISVSSTTQNTTTDITLAPMWSTVSIEINDPKTLKVPSNTLYLRVDLEPAFTRYNIQTKLAMSPLLTHDVWDYQLKDVSKFKEINALIFTYNVSKTTSENNNLKLKVQFYSYAFPTMGKASLISEHIIDLKTQVENGQNYKVSGNLGNIAGIENPSQSFNISLGSFAKDDVNIEF